VRNDSEVGVTIRFAVLGTGRIATEKLLPALNRIHGAALWSVLSRDVDRAHEVAAVFDAQSPRPGYDELDRLLADPQLDAVIIASPDKLHAPQGIAAANAGKHVLVEKPMVTSKEDGDALFAACHAADVKLGVAYHLRWHQGHRKLHHAVSEGRFGDIRHMRLQWNAKATTGDNWRARPEVGKWWSLAGVGTHCLDQILWFMLPICGEIVDFKSVIASSVWNIPHDETALVSMRFASGATAEFCASMVFAGPTRFELYGSSGYAIGERTVGITGAGEMWTGEGPWPFEPSDPYQSEIEDFVAAIREDRLPEVDGAMGLKNCELLLRASDG
jgi:1,5-anhydro-D-fructose reductase (1,5-anhydro-D-mannitol-forming)